jgi:endonuclease/exonuclease/phosphatase family metal-dependent hydrolase
LKQTKIILLITILILLFGNRVASQNLSDLSFGTDSTFDVVTWNIEWFPKNGVATIDSVSKIIEAIDVDLIGVQEIDDSTLFRQMINQLPGYDLFMGSGWFGGLGYVYKTNTINIQAQYKIYDTSPYWNIFPRSPLVMELTYMGEEFIVINNHYKCCGDGILEVGNTSDEEYRRHRANLLLKQYLEANFSSKRVMVIGDLNDVLTDHNQNNVFRIFLNDPTNYLFADINIASGSSVNWSYPGWPSHLDHILISNELFAEFAAIGSGVQTIKVDHFMSGGFADYNHDISDHRPVGIKIIVIPNASDVVEELMPAVTVFPNPTTEQVFLDLKQFEGKVEVKIRNLSGQVIELKEYQGN